jgi:Ser/Thr protein kinase RdoA (MazF antagonist)
LTQAEALAAASEQYGLTGAMSALPSERDQNFLIADARRGKFVLKIANSSDALTLLDCQNQAMRQVEKTVADYRVQRVIPSLEGADITSVHSARSGRDHWLRLLTWLDGAVLADSAARSPVLFESIGAGMAKIDTALCDFSHPAMRRVLQWDLRRAEMAGEHAALLPQARRAHVERLFSQWREVDWTGLRQSAIHGDANDHNVLVVDGHMAGLLDFGDMVYSATVCDLAVVVAYCMLGESEPLSVAAQVIRAYQRHYPLSEAEQRALYPLIGARLGMSVCYSAHNRARNPDDAYQVVSEAAAWDLLGKLESWPAEDVLALIGAACAPPDRSEDAPQGAEPANLSSSDR